MTNPTSAPAAAPPPPTRIIPYSYWWPIAIGAFAGLLMRLAFFGDPGQAWSAMLGSFIIGSPLLVGIVTVYVAELAERRTWVYYFTAPVIAASVYVLSSLVILIEGMICAVIIVPLFAIVAGVAGLAMGAVCRAMNWPRRTIVSCFAALPLLVGGFEHRLPTANTERAIQRELVIDASPEAVWRVLVDTPRISPAEVDPTWAHLIGVPQPTGGTADIVAGRHVRHVTMARGIRFDQVATDWQPNERVSWRYDIDEDSVPPRALDDHVRIGGHYFGLGETTYSLVPEGSGTRLVGVFRYRVSTNFNWYAVPVADFLIGNCAESFLRLYSRRATARPAPEGESAPLPGAG